MLSVVCHSDKDQADQHAHPRASRHFLRLPEEYKRRDIHHVLQGHCAFDEWHGLRHDATPDQFGGEQQRDAPYLLDPLAHFFSLDIARQGPRGIACGAASSRQLDSRNVTISEFRLKQKELL
jgi:hypothetical protein